MRDINNHGTFTVEGDFIAAGDKHEEHKLLIQCTTEELKAELPFREGNMRMEQNRKVRRLKPFYSLCVILAICAGAVGWWKGQGDLLTFALGAASLFVGFATLKATVEPNAFQRDESKAVIEIKKLLLQRRAK